MLKHGLVKVIEYHRHPATGKSTTYVPDFFIVYEDKNKRVHTFILALNDEYEGGETSFPNIKEKYKLRAGDALFFDTLDNYGLDTSDALHGGQPVKSGEKWVCNLWVHKHPY